MIKSITILLVFILNLNLSAQHETDTNDIYVQALGKHLEYLKDFNQRRPDLIRIPNIYFIEEDRIVTMNFPTQINGQKLEILSKEQIIKKIKGDNSITVLAVRPARWKDGQLVITVLEFAVFGNKRKLNFINTANGSSFVVKNSSDCNTLEIERITN